MKGPAMTDQDHESMKTSIVVCASRDIKARSRLNVMNPKRQKIQTRLREEELWLKRYTLKAN
jgi:hypothetical protein